MNLYICPICGNIIEKIEDNGPAIMCCGKKMEKLQLATEGAKEKHAPVVEKVSPDKIEVTVGETIHPMEEEHSIKWIRVEKDNQVIMCYLKPNAEPKALFPYISGSKVYAYCDKHGLWMTEVE